MTVRRGENVEHQHIVLVGSSMVIKSGGDRHLCAITTSVALRITEALNAYCGSLRLGLNSTIAEFRPLCSSIDKKLSTHSYQPKSLGSTNRYSQWHQEGLLRQWRW